MSQVLRRSNSKEINLQCITRLIRERLESIGMRCNNTRNGHHLSQACVVPIAHIVRTVFAFAQKATRRNSVYRTLATTENVMAQPNRTKTNHSNLMIEDLGPPGLITANLAQLTSFSATTASLLRVPCNREIHWDPCSSRCPCNRFL